MSGKYTIIAFSLGMILALILNFAIITRTIDAQNDDARVASYIGMQRARSYQLLTDAIMIERGVGNREQLVQDLKRINAQWQYVQDVLYSGTSVLGLPLHFSSVIESEITKTHTGYNALRTAMVIIVADLDIHQYDIDYETTEMLKYENEYQSHFQVIASMINAEARARTSSILLADIIAFSVVYLASIGGMLSIIVQVVMRLKRVSDSAPLPVLSAMRKEQ